MHPERSDPMDPLDPVDSPVALWRSTAPSDLLDPRDHPDLPEIPEYPVSMDALRRYGFRLF